jgi:hypothetical protein
MVQNNADFRGEEVLKRRRRSHPKGDLTYAEVAAKCRGLASGALGGTVGAQSHAGGSMGPRELRGARWAVREPGDSTPRHLTMEYGNLFLSYWWFARKLSCQTYPRLESNPFRMIKLARRK